MLKRVAVVGSAAFAMLLMFAVAAIAQTPDPDVVSTLTDASADLRPTLIAVAAIGLAIGVVLFAIRKGWRMLKGFSR